MKKLFFFRSHSSNNANSKELSPPSTDKEVYWEKPTKRVDKSAKTKPVSEDQVFDSTPCLRRSFSFSSGSLYDTGKGLRNSSENNVSPHSSSYHQTKQSRCRSSRSCTLTPERANFVDSSIVRNAHSMEKHDCTISRAYSDLSDNSSHSSSNISSKVLDRFIDGEQMERYETKSNISTRIQFENGNVLKKLPRFQFSAPVGHDARKQKSKSRPSGETKISQAPLSSKDGSDNEYCNESPQELAKRVVERLSQSQFLPKMRSKEFDSENPITIEDIYGRNLNRYANAYTDEDSLEMSFFGDKDISAKNLDAATDNDIELFKKFKETEDRATTLLDELQKGNFIQLNELSIPTLIQTIRGLTEEKVNMAVEVSTLFEDRIAERAFFKEQLTELEAQTQRLEKEKNEMQLSLEKELDRRSSEWSIKLEKLQAEEHRLRERVRELAEQNVSLQREVSSSSERTMETRTKISNSEKQVGELSAQVKEAREENHYLQKTLSELQDKTRSAEDDRDCFRRKYDEKVCESKDMHQAVSRLQRTCNDQEKTIEGLQVLSEELGKKSSQENFDFGIAKLQIEHMRLTVVEHTLRKEVESSRVEVDSLRRENIDLLSRLKSNGKEGGFSIFKLDQELQSRINSLQNQMLPLVAESSQLGRKLIEYVKAKGDFSSNKGSASATCLDGQVLIEYEVKLQGLQRAAENLATTTQTMSCVFQEKSALIHELPALGDKSHKCGEQKPEDVVRSELKAETLLTSLLREKLYSRELDVEQLQAELAAAIRGTDVLKSEVQNAMDNFSCINNKMKEAELQMMKKDETINQLQGNLQECKKEVVIMRGLLPKISEERDAMWEEVKCYTENNMLLNSEINVLRKKIEALDEDILMKDGQISILKDSMSKNFDLLATPDPTW